MGYQNQVDQKISGRNLHGLTIKQYQTTKKNMINQTENKLVKEKIP